MHARSINDDKKNDEDENDEREKRNLVERWFGRRAWAKDSLIVCIDKCCNCFCASVWRLVPRR